MGETLPTIATLSFASGKRDLFKVMLVRYFRARWWILLLIIVLAGVSSIWSHGADRAAIAMVLIFLIFFPLFISYSIWRYLSAIETEALYVKRHYEMDVLEVRNILEGGAMSTTPIEEFIKWERITGHYLLYVTKTHYFLVPENCFKSKEDLEWFRSNVLGKVGTGVGRAR